MSKIIFRVSTFFSFFTFAFFASGDAQVVSTDDIKAQMVQDWERAKVYTIDYLNTMPADKYSFKAVDSIRSFAQQMLHLAQGNVFLMYNASVLQPPSYMRANLEGTRATQKDSVMYYVINSYDYCIKAVKGADMTKMGEKKKVFWHGTNRYSYDDENI